MIMSWVLGLLNVHRLQLVWALRKRHTYCRNVWVLCPYYLDRFEDKSSKISLLEYSWQSLPTMSASIILRTSRKTRKSCIASCLVYVLPSSILRIDLFIAWSPLFLLDLLDDCIIGFELGLCCLYIEEFESVVNNWHHLSWIEITDILYCYHMRLFIEMFIEIIKEFLDLWSETFMMIHPVGSMRLCECLLNICLSIFR